MAEARARGELQARIVRPGALIDWARLEIPGLLGRRLFGHWHLGLGRRGLPIAVCEVGRAAAVVAWCADHFAEAPPLVNLIDPAIQTRGQLLDLFHQHGWRGRVGWVPISLLATAAMTMRHLVALARGERARPLAVWSILRPRRYDAAMSTEIFAAASPAIVRVQPAFRPMSAQASQLYDQSSAGAH